MPAVGTCLRCFHARPRDAHARHRSPGRAVDAPTASLTGQPTARNAWCGGRWLRPATALAAAVLVAACTASTGTSATRSHPATRPPVAANPAGCQLPVGNAPSPNGKIVLGVISLGNALSPTVPVHRGRSRYWQKDALCILDAHQTVTITVPKSWRNRAAITWG